MSNRTTEVDTVELEKSFNETLEEFRKSYGGRDGADLEKAKGKKAAPREDEEDADVEVNVETDDDDEEYEEEEDEEKMEKSVEDILAEDPEAEAAMDVEPFLRQLAKAIDRRIDGLAKSFDGHFNGVETMLKSQGRAMLVQMELQKSQVETVDRIAKEDRSVAGLTRLGKSRFEGSDSVQVDGATVLQKSQDWVREQKISLVESGMIEARVNRGLLGRQNDGLDQKVQKLLKEESR